MTDINDYSSPGDDREPVEPDEYDEQPVDLDEVEQRLERLKFLAQPFGMVATRVELNGAEDLHDLAALVGQDVYGLIAEVREARRRIAEFEALPYREEFATTAQEQVPPNKHHPYRVTAGEALKAEQKGRQGWARRLTIHPWELLSPKAPF